MATPFLVPDPFRREVRQIREKYVRLMNHQDDYLDYLDDADMPEEMRNNLYQEASINRDLFTADIRNELEAIEATQPEIDFVFSFIDTLPTTIRRNKY